MHSDVKKAIEFAPTYMGAITECARLEKAHAEAQERMKEEVVGLCAAVFFAWLVLINDFGSLLFRQTKGFGQYVSIKFWIKC